MKRPADPATAVKPVKGTPIFQGRFQGGDIAIDFKPGPYFLQSIDSDLLDDFLWGCISASTMLFTASYVFASICKPQLPGVCYYSVCFQIGEEERHCIFGVRYFVDFNVTHPGPLCHSIFTITGEHTQEIL